MVTTGPARDSLPLRPSSSLPEGVGSRRQLERLVRGSTSCRTEAALTLTLDCLDAFIAHGGSPEAAAREVADRCIRFGETHAADGLTDEALTTAVHAIGRGLRRQVIPAAVRELGCADVETLTRAVQGYLLRVVGHVRRGLQTVERFHALSPQRRRQALAVAVFESGDARALRGLAIACEIDATARLSPVVATDPETALSQALRSHPEVVAAPRSAEAAVPASWTNEQVRLLADTDVARGPGAELGSLSEAVRLTRTTAAVATAGTPVTESRDVLAGLLVSASPVLADMLVDAHLAPLATLPTTRRNTLARTLLTWLEHGRPVNEIARTMGLPAQTVHTRLGTARRLLGDTLTDPDGRLELLAALRVALPLWEAESRSS